MISHSFSEIRQVFQRKTKVWFLGVIFFIAVTLRIYQINEYDFWYDELIATKFSYAYIQWNAQQDQKNLLQIFAQKLEKEINPPLYYLLIYVYSFFFGSENDRLRFLSVALSLLSLVFLYLLSRKFVSFSEKESLVTVGIMACSPVQLWYAQECRGTALDSFLATGIGYYFFQWLHTGKKRNWGTFALVSLLAIFANTVFIFFLIACGGIFFDKKYRIYWRQWLLTIIVILIPAGIYLFFLKSNISVFMGHFWLRGVSVFDLLQTWGVFIAGYSASSPGMFNYCILLAFFLFIAGICLTYRKGEKAEAFFLFAVIVLPIAALYVVSQLAAPMYITRKLLMCAPFFYLLAGKSLCVLAQRPVRLLLSFFMISVVAICLINYYNNHFIERQDGKDFYPGVHGKIKYQHLFRLIQRAYSPGDAIIASDFQSFTLALYYFQFPKSIIAPIYYLFSPGRLEPFERLYVRHCVGDFYREDYNGVSEKPAASILYYPQLQPHAAVREDIDCSKMIFNKLWVCYATWNQYGPYEHSSHQVRQILKKYYKKIKSFENHKIHLHLYEKRAQYRL